MRVECKLLVRPNTNSLWSSLEWIVQIYYNYIEYKFIKHLWIARCGQIGVKGSNLGFYFFCYHLYHDTNSTFIFNSIDYRMELEVTWNPVVHIIFQPLSTYNHLFNYSPLHRPIAYEVGSNEAKRVGLEM